jgi:hypothetical protein
MFDQFTKEKTKLSKLATGFAVGFLVSLGLCGANFLAIVGGGGRSFSVLLLVTAYAELAGMVVCAIGLLIVGLVAAWKALQVHTSKPADNGDER